jgi:hypothetical protein
VCIAPTLVHALITSLFSPSPLNLDNHHPCPLFPISEAVIAVHWPSDKIQPSRTLALSPASKSNQRMIDGFKAKNATINHRNNNIKAML